MSISSDKIRPFFSDVEALFSEYVEFYGGHIVEKLKENKTDRPNADFYFEKPEVVAELKVFTKDIFSEKEDSERFLNLFNKWISNGYIKNEEVLDIIFRRKSLPEKCRMELVEKASKTIERAIHKANKQIKETKKTLNKNDAYGAIFIINDGNYFFSNIGFIQVISNVLKRKFVESSFDVIVYLTINQNTWKEGSDLDHSIWVPIYTKVDEQGETIVSDEFHSFINNFGEVLGNDFLTMKTSYPLQELRQISDFDKGIEEINKHRFIPKEVIYKKK